MIRLNGLKEIWMAEDIPQHLFVPLLLFMLLVYWSDATWPTNKKKKKEKVEEEMMMKTTLWKVDFYGKFFSFLAAFWGHLGIRVNILPFGILWDLLGSFGILSRVGHIRWGLQSFWDSLGSFGILHRGRHGIVGFLGHSFRIVRDRLGYFGMFHRWRCELKESTGFRGIF